MYFISNFSGWQGRNARIYKTENPPVCSKFLPARLYALSAAPAVRTKTEPDFKALILTDSGLTQPNIIIHPAEHTYLHKVCRMIIDERNI
ncbi:MAG: hypothetical protein AMK71_09055 [Nitrospira bacterium SG8_35_4]|nr:MAG: hypothetical protein AMK71_09055 [Nitrospira bacterium SG8_35_4]